jgi:hypothetical protein
MTARNVTLALVITALTAGLVTFTSASFTADTATDATTFRAGKLEVRFTHTGALDAAALRPGMTREREVEVENVGTVPATITAEPALDRSAPLAQVLRLRPYVCAAPAACSPVGDTQTLAAADTVRLGRIAPGETRRFRLVMTFPAAGSDAEVLQGAALDFDLTWSAES